MTMLVSSWPCAPLFLCQNDGLSAAHFHHRPLSASASTSIQCTKDDGSVSRLPAVCETSAQNVSPEAYNLDLSASSNRTGLFRTPISGGVQNATLAHSLPDPSVAVRNLMEQARFVHLSTMMSRMHHRRRGYPFGSYVDFAPDSCGHPIFSLSPLAIHTRNLLENPRCSVLVQNPGWSGLANARVTLFGDVYPLSAKKQEWAHHHFMAKHQQASSQQWRTFDYFRMDVISDIYFIGGFGTVAWVDVKAFESANPDTIAKRGSEKILKDLNDAFSERLRNLLSIRSAVDEVAFISIDSKGADVRVQQGAQHNVQRLSFGKCAPVQTIEKAIEAVETILQKGCKVYGIN